MNWRCSGRAKTTPFGPFAIGVTFKRSLCSVLLGLVCWVICVGTAEARRVALVIGNGAYSYDAAWELTNPPNDAQAFAQILEAQGADVLLLLDGDFEEMQSAVAQFSAMASGAEAAIFYYAGHGFQVARQNYILPTDFAVGTREETARTSMALSDVLAAMKDADGPKLVFLDACRNNPLDLEEDSSEEAGLARVDVEGLEELWIAYAAAENSVAMDGEEGGNSPFTEALLTHIGTPGLSVDDMIRRVRKRRHQSAAYRRSTGSMEPFVADRAVRFRTGPITTARPVPAV